MTRKIDKKAKTVFVLLIVAVVAVIGVISITSIKATGERQASQSLTTGTIIYDNLYEPVEVTTTSTLSYGSNGQYILSNASITNINLGAHTLAWDGSIAKVYGGGFLIDGNGNVQKIDDYTEIDCSDVALIKMADRRYILIGPEITDTTKVVTANNYLYIVIDIVGNARMISKNMSIKTTQPTVVQSGNVTFDIANEMFYIDEQSYDVAKLLGGSTNEYDTRLVKKIEEEDTPDVIDISVKGGDGGTGGTGGTGGDGGNGGNGGKGGKGGKGGAGGAAETKEVVKIVTLTNVEGTSANEIRADFNFVDPFGTLGIVYLELHPAKDMGALTIKNLYSSSLEEGMQGTVDEYWEKEKYTRVTLSPYMTTYTFSDLDEDSAYYVVMVSRTLDDTDKEIFEVHDYIKVSTLSKQSKIDINSMAKNANDATVTLTLYLKDPTIIKDNAQIVLYFTESEFMTVDLKESQVKMALSQNGFTISMSVTPDKLTKSKYIKAVLNNVSDDGLEVTEILSMQTANYYYGN